MILCIGATPAAQRVLVFRRLVLDSVNRAQTAVDGAAGKSINVAKVLQILGERPITVGFLGGPRGQQLRIMLESRGIGLDMVKVNAPTRECTTLVDQASGAITELVEEGSPADPNDYQRLLEVVQRRMAQCRAVVMSGTIPGGGPSDLYAHCIRCAQQTGALSIVDARGALLDEALKTRPSLVKPNRLELETTLGKKLDDEPAVLDAMRELEDRGARQVVITAGAQPALAFDGCHAWRIQAPQVAVVNPIGSGDAFTAGLVWRLLRGDDLGEACRWASAVGAANALTLMTGEVNRHDVENLVGQVKCERIN